MTGRDFSSIARVLADEGFLPEDLVAVALMGSVARGWSTSASDLDVLVISDTQLTHPEVRNMHASVDPPILQAAAFPYDGVRYEVKYWLDDQVDQALAKASWPAYENEPTARDRLDEHEQFFMARLLTCVPITGDGWIKRRQAEIAASAFRAIQLTEALTNVDKLTHAAAGQLGTGDLHSATVTAREAFDWAVNALLISEGEYEVLAKWRVRRFREAKPELLSFDEYWAYETMRNYDPADPADWVRRVAALCQRVSMGVEI